MMKFISSIPWCSFIFIPFVLFKTAAIANKTGVAFTSAVIAAAPLPGSPLLKLRVSRQPKLRPPPPPLGFWLMTQILRFLFEVVT